MRHMTETDLMQPCARWTDDCQGKKDYDGRLLSISTRYWPGNYRSDGRPSASAAILINHGEPDQYGYGDHTVWRETDIAADTETEVKAAVEVWVREQMADVLARLAA
jgi:hypothetical protein